MPIEIRNPAAPHEFLATCDDTSASALDEHVEREEIFGPILSALAHDTAGKAASVANDIAFGLSSCLHSERTAIVKRIVAESGMLRVNTVSVPRIRLPLVGVKDSTGGAGGSNGPATVQFHATEHPVDRRAGV